MQDKSFSPSRQSAFAARYEAQKIAFGPVVFQCVRYAWKKGILQALADAAGKGLSVGDMVEKGLGSHYSLKVVLESCLSAGAVEIKDGRYVLDKIGYCVLTDRITQVNLDFIHDVCYLGLHELERSLDEEKPHGLKVFGDWPTLYQGLSQLEEPARTSWFAFDHHYSDVSFPLIMKAVFERAPRRVMDIGANTGKFTLAALAHDANAELHLVDLPGQLAVARKNLQDAGVASRATLHPVDLLDDSAPLPAGMDVIWMSQFLSCFSERAIASILRRVAKAVADGGRVIIMDTFWDRQQYDIASYCLINTSPYFTAMASGNSKVYEASDYVRLAEEAGLRLVATTDGIGYCHSLLTFERTGSAGV